LTFSNKNAIIAYQLEKQMSFQALNEVKAINPMAAVVFEGYLFTLASKHIEGYTGGSWTSTKVGEHMIAVPPSDVGKTARLINANNYCDVVTDAKTIGACITTMALNYTMWKYENNPQVCDKLIDLYESLVEAVRSDESIDRAAFNRFAD
jgi:hypothetical protein